MNFLRHPKLPYGFPKESILAIPHFSQNKPRITDLCSVNTVLCMVPYDSIIRTILYQRDLTNSPTQIITINFDNPIPVLCNHVMIPQVTYHSQLPKLLTVDVLLTKPFKPPPMVTQQHISSIPDLPPKPFVAKEITIYEIFGRENLVTEGLFIIDETPNLPP